MESEREELVIGALVHDIGKLVRRAGLVEKRVLHTSAGQRFVDDVEIDGEKIFAPYQKFILKHHERDLDEDRLTWFVCYSDRIASTERQMKDDEGFEEMRTLENILSRIYKDVEGSGNTFFAPLPVGELKRPTNERVASEEDFRKLYNMLVEDAKKLKLNVENLRFLLYKYLSFVPQSTQKSGTMDISLYDHMKVTAMIALSLYDYVVTNGIEIEKFEDLKGLLEEKVLLLVGGDVSGIQKFIRDVSSKGALRSFRGRSFFIDLLQEIIVDKILDETGFFRTNVHYIGGGHFYLILSNTERNIQRISKIREEINRWLMDKTSDLKLIIGYEPMSLAEVKDPSNAFLRLKNKIARAKLNMYSQEELSAIFDLVNITSVQNLRTCRVCGKRTREYYPLREGEEPIACEFCKQMYEYGRQMVKAKYFARDPHGQFEILNDRYSFSDEPSELRSYVLDFPERYPKNSENLVFINVARYAKHEEFGEMAEESSGKKLACFQADIDGLGDIFKEGLEIKTMSRISTLSRLFTYFFKYRVKKIAEDKNVAIVYASGDDLFIVGGWEDVLRFAYEMQIEFREFTGHNDRVTYTGCFVLFDEKESISKVKEAAEYAENIGKNRKDCVVLHHGMQKHSEKRWLEKLQIVGWKEFIEKTYPTYEKLSRLVGSVDRSVIRKVLTLSLEESPLNRAFLAYIEARENEADRDFTKLVRLSDIPALNSIVQLLDLKVRRD